MVDIERINQETRERVRSLFTQGVSKGMTMDEIADAIESPDFDDAFDVDRFIEDEPPAPEPLQPKAGRLLIQRDPEGRVAAIDAPAQKAAEPKPLEPVAMRIERDEAGRISRVVPEGSEPDARIMDIMAMFRQSLDIQNGRPIEVHVELPGSWKPDDTVTGG